MSHLNLPFDSYIKLEHDNILHTDYVVINWCLGNTCNYSCSYCPEGLHNASVKWPSQEVVTAFIDKALAHYVGKKLYFEFTGGEVTLWKDLLPVAAYLRTKGCKVGIISNGSRSLDLFEKLIPNIDHICLSFHAEQGNEDHFYSVVEFCADKIRTHVNFMMKPDLFNKCLSFAMRIKNIPKLSMALQPLVVGLVGKILDYTDLQTQTMNKEYELITKHIQHAKSFETYRGAMTMVTSEGEKNTLAAQGFIASGNNNWKDWYCYAGLEQIVVDMDSHVYRGWCKAGESIGRIDDKNLKLPSRPIRCPKSNCHCNLDIMSTKEKTI
ncbi:MAG: radical SAM protein [Pseudobdellovibrio sp.]